MADRPYLSLQRFPGNGTTGPWEVNFAGNREDENAGTEPYIDPSDVYGFIVTPATDTTPEVQDPVELIHEGANTFSTAVPVPSDKILLLRRLTEDEYSLVNFQRLQAVSAYDLDTSNRQLLFLTQEAVDRSTLAEEAANSVRDLAQTAVATSLEALDTAEQAVLTSGAALLTAQQAVATSEAAEQTAAAAEQAAEAAVLTADNAEQVALGIEAKADAAVETADEAKDLAQEALDLATAQGVASFNGRSGTVVPASGDYDSSMIPHGAGTVQTALNSGASQIAALQTATGGLSGRLDDAEEALEDAVEDLHALTEVVVTRTPEADGAALIPVGGDAARPGAPTNGMFRYNSEQQRFEGYQDGEWKPIAGDGIPMFDTTWCADRASIPAGYVAADGQLLSRATYPTAAAALVAGKMPQATDATWLADPLQRGKYTLGDGSTTFRLPDYNGKFAGSLGAVFMRGDGTLSAAVAGAIQQDAMQSHVHGQNMNSAGNTVSPEVSTTGTGASVLGYYHTSGVGTLTSNQVQTAAPSGARTASETRPLNVTGCWIIKLFGAVTEVGSANAAQLASDYANLAGRTSTVESQVALQALTYTTPVSASGTAVDLTGIPATVKRITVILRNISSAGGNYLVMQLGTSAGVDSTGTYRGTASSDNVGVAYTDAWALVANTSSSSSHNGTVTLVRAGGDHWVLSGTVGGDIGGSLLVGSTCVGTKTLSGALTRIRLAWAGFVDTFDAGQVTLLLES